MTTVDPRIEPLAKALFEQTRPAWSWDCPPRNHHVAQDYWRAQAAALLSEALDPVDPLRTLLADERQALELLASALWELDCAAAWDGTAFADLDEQTRTAYLESRERKNRAVLAALREVAGL